MYLIIADYQHTAKIEQIEKKIKSSRIAVGGFNI